MKSAISIRYREDLPIGSSLTKSGLGNSPPFRRLASRFVRRLSDRFTGPAARRNSPSDSEFDLISPPSSELMPMTATSSGGGGADEYAAFLGGFACFPTTPISLAAHPGQEDLLHGRRVVPTRPRPIRTTSMHGIGGDPAHLPPPQHMAHPTASYASHHPSPRISSNEGHHPPPTRGATVQGGDAGRNVDRSTGITTARHTFDSSRPRTLLRRLTTSSSISLRSSSHRNEGQAQQQGHLAAATATTEEEEEGAGGGGGGGAPVLSSRFSDWSTASSSRTPSPARSCGCRWTWWSSSSENLHGTPTSSSSLPEARCAEHAASLPPAPSESAQQDQDMEQEMSGSRRPGVV
ncbi:hypothetical protein RHOSPDRAFT_33442 [Rhodotorula sp. JG-1b]|nr:hypothetical protein RHOSPDRAFT_33442 [Rhodotorula sp. JG-1b]